MIRLNPVKHDAVDELIRQWRRERPETDPSPLAVTSRLLMLFKHLENSADEALAPFGLTLWQFDVLAVLRRSGAPYMLSPTQLLQAMTLSSGAMTNRIDRLENAGFVERHPDPNDRRGVLIALTASGRDLVDRALEARLSNAASIVSVLSEDEAESVVRALRKLLLHFGRCARDGASMPAMSKSR